LYNEKAYLPSVEGVQSLDYIMIKGFLHIMNRFMIKKDGIWTIIKFEFDEQDGMGAIWRYARGIGYLVENITRHFLNRGYTITEWDENV